MAVFRSWPYTNNVKSSSVGFIKTVASAFFLAHKANKQSGRSFLSIYLDFVTKKVYIG